MFSQVIQKMSSSQFDIYLEEKETIVVCRDHSIVEEDVETDELWPHKEKECHCVNVQHVTSFRLKTVKKHRYDDNFEEADLYIAHEPSNGFDVKCLVMANDSTACYQLQSFYAETYKFSGWKYLTTIPSSLVLCKLSLNLYRDRLGRYACPAIPAPEPSLYDNMSQLFMDGTYADVTVSSVDGATVKAHRGILAKRCEVFRATLEHNEIKDRITTHLNVETLRQILTFIYTDKTPKIGDCTPELYMAADFYQLPTLKDVCVVALQKQLKVENALETLELAYRYCLTNLLTFTLEFIKTNYKLIIKTKDWKNINNIDLVKMVRKFNAQKSRSKMT